MPKTGRWCAVGVVGSCTWESGGCCLLTARAGAGKLLRMHGGSGRPHAPRGARGRTPAVGCLQGGRLESTSTRSRGWRTWSGRPPGARAGLLRAEARLRGRPLVERVELGLRRGRREGRERRWCRCRAGSRGVYEPDPAANTTPDPEQEYSPGYFLQRIECTAGLPSRPNLLDVGLISDVAPVKAAIASMPGTRPQDRSP